MASKFVNFFWFYSFTTFGLGQLVYRTAAKVPSSLFATLDLFMAFKSFGRLTSRFYIGLSCIILNEIMRGLIQLIN